MVNPSFYFDSAHREVPVGPHTGFRLVGTGLRPCFILGGICVLGDEAFQLHGHALFHTAITVAVVGGLQLAAVDRCLAR